MVGILFPFLYRFLRPIVFLGSLFKIRRTGKMFKLTSPGWRRPSTPSTKCSIPTKVSTCRPTSPIITLRPRSVFAPPPPNGNRSLEVQQRGVLMSRCGSKYLFTFCCSFFGNLLSFIMCSVSPNGQTSANDFTSFGGWTRPTLKTYNTNIASCSVSGDQVIEFYAQATAYWTRSHQNGMYQ